MPTHQFPADAPPTRLDQFLAATGEANRSRIQSAIRAGLVSVDGIVTAKPSFTLQNGAHAVDWSLLQPFELTPIAGDPILIHYEDAGFVIAEKPAGMVTHPTTADHADSFIGHLLAQYPDIANASLDPDDPESRWRPGIVHRLDADTSGLIVVARSHTALLALQRQFQEHTVQKIYLALLWGDWPSEPAELTDYLVRSGSADENRFIVSRTEGEGRLARLSASAQRHYRTASGFSLTLARVELFTGRTHQIRVQTHAIGHPVLGDKTYSHRQASSTASSLGATRQLLHSHELSLTHPETGERITAVSELPADFAAVLTKLRPDASVDAPGSSN